MGGKSTFLRQNAIISILAQMGSFVPANAAHLGVIDAIFSRVGAADDLARDRSTFMIEMMETATILRRATPRSMVIMDEIGRGTSTTDGLSIAWAVIEYLHNNNKCRVLFATHYIELASLKQKLKHLTCYKMGVIESVDSVTFTHKVVSGVADKSYGIHVAQLAGVPRIVIDRAEEIFTALDTSDKKVQKSIIDISVNKLSPNHEIIEKLLQVNLDNTSPKEALELLYTVQQKILKK